MIYWFHAINVFLFILCCSSLYADIKGDVNDDNLVNATEAIYALQVSAGIQQPLTTNEIDGHSLNAADNSPVNALYVDNEGKVGIGTEKPLASLTVKGNLNYSKELSGHVMILKDSNRVIGAGTFFTEELKNGDSVLIDGNYYIVQEVIDNKELFITSNVNQTLVEKKIYIADDLFQVQNANSETKLILDTKGNVGIGIINPGAKLDINGTMIRKIYRNSSFSKISHFSNQSSVPLQVPDKTLTFNKQKNETSIRIEYSDYIGAIHKTNCLAAYLELRVDGTSCPGGELVFYNYISGTDDDRTFTYQTFKGFCEGLSAGTYEIQVWIHTYPGGYVSFQVGHETSRWTIEAEEVY